MALTQPAIHLDETSASRILKSRKVAHTALTDALAILAKAEPNGRDYYLKPGSLTVAVLQHRRRMQAIQEVVRELEDETERILTQERRRTVQSEDHLVSEAQTHAEGRF